MKLHKLLTQGRKGSEAPREIPFFSFSASMRLCASALKVILLLTSCALSATIDYNPWPNQIWEFELKPEFGITTANNDHKEDLDFNLSVMTAERWQMQLDCGFFSSPERSPTYSHSSATARYIWLDDVIGDPVSLVTGCTIRSVSTAALLNPLTFYHSQIEFEGHLTLGTETAPCDTWSSRRFCALLLGIPTKGKAWGGFLAKNEWNFCTDHILACSIRGEANFGGKSLNSSLPFNGYNDIAYQFLDLGVEYRYGLCEFGELGFEYFYRVYAKNSPKNIQQFIFFIRYPFSI